MTRKRSEMKRVKEVLRLSQELGWSAREIAKSTRLGRTTVREYLERAEAADLQYKDISCWWTSRACARKSRSAASPASCWSRAHAFLTPPWCWPRGSAACWSGSAKAACALYAAGQPGGARADRLLYQARVALDDDRPPQRRARDVSPPLRRGRPEPPLHRAIARHGGRARPRDVQAARPAARRQLERAQLRPQRVGQRPTRPTVRCRRRRPAFTA